MTNIRISAVQFRAERVAGFEDFERQVRGLMEDVPLDSDYVLFPELFTVGLLTSFPDWETAGPSAMMRLDQFTDPFKKLFADLAAQRGQIIVAGSHLEKRGEDYFNVSTIFQPNGDMAEHKKSHIFPAEGKWKTREGEELNVFDIGPARIGIAICYEAEIPEVAHILSRQGADIVFCPSYTYTEFGFWRVRHCAQSRSIENQIYVVHCPTICDIGKPIDSGYGRSAILTPCDTPWTANGIAVEADTNVQTVITGTVNLDALYENRKTGAATTYNDRIRKSGMYANHAPYTQERSN
ncbi:Predicted amidohydrolase [Paenibacillus algorifonticola]|uniref:Predicted amidohydrolase n=1 Tax=Paenibacillus algorifonticola TaxID=684063 RepID=A0A1I2A3X5_9BACL|nr:nitrilase-related carbon-nitrogen hydrolase [Paenibacillus algorifonticola]SFE38844.1 Predicted amidohydrolase [Paenibacillus algorifonticola]